MKQFDFHWFYFVSNSRFKSYHRDILGSRMKITLTCVDDDSKSESSFHIDEYVAGYPMVGTSDNEEEGTSPSPDSLMFSSKESICGPDDKRNAICYQTSFPTIYNKARAVARLYINGSGACTGWLVSECNLLFTNEHCINSASDVLNTDFEFMGEETNCNPSSPGSIDGGWMSNRGVIFDGLSLLALSSTWDYALIQLDGNPAASYG